MLKISILSAVFAAIGAKADADYIQPYPELNEYQHANYAESYQQSGYAGQGQVIYDYQD